MPAFYTHYRFASDVYKKINKNNINYKYYELFNQSFDNLYYYNFLSLKKGKEIREFGKKAHTYNTNLYFKNIINYILKNNLTKDEYVLAYLFGSLNHYICDSTFHPFVFFKTGLYQKNKKTKKYNGKHAQFEIMIDAYFYNIDTEKNISKFKIYKLIKKKKFPTNLINTINYTYQKTFNQFNMGKIYNKSYNQEKLCYMLFMYDKFGIKKFAYKILDKIFPYKDNYECFSYHINNINKKDLNLSKNTWCYPSDINSIYDYDINDLYKICIKKAVDLSNKLSLVLEKKYNLNKFLNELGNKSYLTGKNDRKEMKYFEY